MTRRLPISPSPGPLEEYAARFDDLFRARAQREGFRRYLKGLLLPAERNKTLTALANTEPSTGAQRKEAQSLQWFLSESGWDAEAVNRRRLEILLQSAETAPHASGVLIIDETGARKDGKKTAHVGKRYLGGIGKIENGVVSVSSLWADERLYYPPANGRALHPGAPFRAGEGRTRFPPQAQDSVRTGEGRARSRDAERATSRIATGRSSATTYHLSPTRQRTMLASRSRTPAHPRVKASTTMAAMMELQGSIGTLSGLAKTKGQSHHASTNARTKNTTRSWRFSQFMLLLPPRRDHDAMYVGPAHLAEVYSPKCVEYRFSEVQIHDPGYPSVSGRG
jgi:hypothetical protein